MKEIKCAKCGITFGITEYIKDFFLDSGKTFYCTHGHANYYPGKESELEAAKSELRKTKLQLRKSKRRCPYCTGYYKKLDQHIRKQHPDEKKP